MQSKQDTPSYTERLFVKTNITLNYLQLETITLICQICEQQKTALTNYANGAYWSDEADDAYIQNGARCSDKNWSKMSECGGCWVRKGGWMLNKGTLMIKHVNTCDNCPLGAKCRPCQCPYEPRTTVYRTDQKSLTC